MKIFKKAVLITVLLASILISSTSVSAWFRVNKGTQVTVNDVTQPYWLDLLIPADTASTLSSSQLDTLLPDDYMSTIYSDTMNGYRDEDGFVSFRLYNEETYQVTQTSDNVFMFSFYYVTAFTYKIVLVFEDGSMNTTQAITQSYDFSEITYNLDTIEIVQSNMVYPVLINPEPDLTSNYLIDLFLFMILIIVIFALDSVAIIVFGRKNIKPYMLIGFIQIPVIGLGYLFEYYNNSHLFPNLIYLCLFAFLVIFILEFRYLSLRDIEKKSWLVLLFIILLNILTVFGAIQIGMIFS